MATAKFIKQTAGVLAEEAAVATSAGMNTNNTLAGFNMTEENTPQPERRKQWHTPETCQNILDVQAKFNDGSARMQRIEENVQRVADHQVESDKSRQRMEEKLDENTEITQQLLSIIQAGRGFFKVMGWVVEAAKWGAGVVLAFGSVWFMFKDHHK